MLLLPVTVEAQAAFLLTPQRRIAPEKLCGAPYSYRFDIDRSALHEGKNFGALVFRSGETEQQVPISLKAGAAERRGFAPQNRTAELREGRHMLRYRHAHALFLLTGRREQLGEAEAALREAEHEKEIDAQRAALYTAELLAARGNTARAQQYLDALDGTFSGIRVAGTERLKMYLADSLKSLLSGDEHRKNRTAERVEREIVREGKAELLPALLLLVPEYPTARAAKWEKLLKHCYRQGSRSVYLYALLARAFPPCARVSGAAGGAYGPHAGFARGPSLSPPGAGDDQGCCAAGCNPCNRDDGAAARRDTPRVARGL